MGQERPDVLCKATLDDVATSAVQAWSYLWGERPSKDALCLLLAQMAFETGWFTKGLHCWNFGNAKAVAGGEYDWTYFRCNEIIDDKVVWFDPPHPACCFRAFPTLRAGLVDHLVMLKSRFRRAWPALTRGAAGQFAHDLKRQGYYTDSEDHYSSTLQGVMQTVKRRLAGLDVDAIPLELSDDEKRQVMALVALTLRMVDP